MKLQHVPRIIILFFITIVSLSSAQAQGDLLLTQKRLVFDGSKRSMEINLANTGKDSASYNISFLQYRMKEDGGFVAIETPDSNQLFADKFLRYYPRTVTLAPNEAQSVKVQLINQDKMQDGEYRSHLYFRAVPRPTPLGEDATSTLGDSSLSVKISAVFGITMPIIIRKGQANTTATITNIKHEVINDTTHLVKLSINRNGNMSTYGDLMVTYISDDGSETKIGHIKGLAVYTPNAFRNMSVLLSNAKYLNFSKGRIRVTYQDQSNKPVKYAEELVDLKAGLLTGK